MPMLQINPPTCSNIALKQPTPEAVMDVSDKRDHHTSSNYSEQGLPEKGAPDSSSLPLCDCVDMKATPTDEPSAEPQRPANVHFDMESLQHDDPNRLYANYTPTTTSTISTAAYADDVADGVLRQAMGAHEPDHAKSDDTLVGDFVTKWEPAIPPQDLEKFPGVNTLPLGRRIRHQWLNAYQRLFALVLIVNVVAIVVTMVQRRHAKPFGTRLEDVATATAANVTAAILIRQENVINLLYDILTLTPKSMPLRFRRAIAKFYHFGGIHSGCAVSASLWFILYTVLLTKQFIDGDFRSIAVIALTYCLVFLLTTICLFAIPRLRFRIHNVFESFHRFGGWLAVGLFWTETILVTYELSAGPNAQSFGLTLVKTPAFWLLIAVTVCIILPWLRLRKVQAWPEILSPRAARIHFNYTSIGKVVGIRIANNPLKEWHPFATIPEADGSSFSIIVSDAGDWTNKAVRSPSYEYWVRGVPISGILRMASIFKRVVVVTTGSGIGPCLSLLIAHTIPCRILWSAPSPLKQYGPGTIGAVLKADPQAVIVDTKVTGRCDISSLAYRLYTESEAEAVFIVSNQQVTSRFVLGMESRGVPAYGPIWDS